VHVRGLGVGAGMQGWPQLHHLRPQAQPSRQPLRLDGAGAWLRWGWSPGLAQAQLQALPALGSALAAAGPHYRAVWPRSTTAPGERACPLRRAPSWPRAPDGGTCQGPDSRVSVQGTIYYQLVTPYLKQ